MNAIANCVQKIMRKIVKKNTILNSIAPIGNCFFSLRLCQSLHEKPQLYTVANGVLNGQGGIGNLYRALTKWTEKTNFAKNLLSSLVFSDDLLKVTTLSQIYVDVQYCIPLNISRVDTCDNMIAGESNKQEPDSDIEDSLGLFV
jgi:hypothetical protein